MTITTATSVPSRSGVAFEEPYWRFTESAGASRRTDTPDLMGLFSAAIDDARLTEGYRVMADEDRALAEADMAAGVDTLD